MMQEFREIRMVERSLGQGLYGLDLSHLLARACKESTTLTAIPCKAAVGVGLRLEQRFRV